MMQITSASQQFAVAEQKTVAYGRKQQLLSKATTEPRPATIAAMPVAANTAAPAANSTTAQPQPEQTSDDDQVFNAFQTVGMVKRILAQLSAHNDEWLGKPLQAEFAAKEVDSFSFSAAVSAQSVWFGASQSRQDEAGQVLATEQWDLGYQAVQANFSGELTLNSGETISFAFEFSMAVSWARYSYTEQQLQDPLVVSLSGKPVQLDSPGTEFDLRNDGNKVKLPQLAAQQYYLAADRNQDKQINNGSELFGPQSGHGFAELAEFDDNGNGFIDPADDIWQYLYLWRPKQQLLSMTEARLGAFSLSSAATPMPLLNQSHQPLGEIQRSGLAFTQDAKPLLLQQIDLVV
jgi:hypothetical protein